jgi:DNA-binding CsgD family transcriptional regulator
MSKIDDFFSDKNMAKNIFDKDFKQTENYLEPIKAFSRTTYKSVYVIDYQKKGFEYVSENPLFLCGHTAEEVKEMGYEFYFKYVIEKDLDLLLKINTVGFYFYAKLPQEKRKNYNISYDFHLKNQDGKIILINQKLTPLFLTSDGKLWKAICIVSLSTNKNSGNIVVSGKGEVFKYDLTENVWRTSEKIKLSDREKEIINFSTRGYTIAEIADAIFVSPDTVKFHRRKLFEKLDVSNISDAIMFTISNNLI